MRTLNITDKTGRVVAIKSVTEDQDLMIINKSGITLRLRVADVRQAGRATQGVTLIGVEDDDTLSRVQRVVGSDSPEMLAAVGEAGTGDEPAATDDAAGADDAADASGADADDDGEGAED